jgi:hypothetical protein
MERRVFVKYAVFLTVIALAACGKKETYAPEYTPTPLSVVSPSPSGGASGGPSPVPSPDGNQPLPRPSPARLYTGDAAFEPYVVGFIAWGASAETPVRWPKNLSIAFGPLSQWSPTVIGLCEFIGNEDNPRISHNVTIKKFWWDRASEISRQNLISHELGHCVLGRYHDLELEPDLTPVSIMFPSLVSDGVFQEHDRNDGSYESELFQTAPAFRVPELPVRFICGGG